MPPMALSSESFTRMTALAPPCTALDPVTVFSAMAEMVITPPRSDASVTVTAADALPDWPDDSSWARRSMSPVPVSIEDPAVIVTLRPCRARLVP